MLLLWQYGGKAFKKHFEFIACFFWVEQNNELLLKNLESWLTNTSPLFEMNATQSYNFDRSCGRGCGHGGGWERGHSREHNMIDICLIMILNVERNMITPIMGQ